MKTDLFLIANATEARLFSRQSPHDPLVPLATLDHPEGRLKSSELADDRLGHGSSDQRPGGVSFTPRLDPRRKKHLQFAHQLARRVDEALAQQPVGRLVIFASCPFLGELKGQLSAAAGRVLHAAIDTDLTDCPPGELQQRIDHELQAAAKHAQT